MQTLIKSAPTSPTRSITRAFVRCAPIGLLAGALLWSTTGAVQPWQRPADPEFAIVSCAWWMAAGLTVWLTASVFAVVATNGAPSGARVERFVMPGSRRVAASLLMLGVMATSACSSGEAAPRLHAIDAPATTLDTDELTPLEAATPEAAPPEIDPPDAERLAAPPARSLGIDPHELLASMTTPATIEEATPTTYAVVKGDNLWDIATTHVLDARPEATVSEVAAYWRELIAQNEATLWSGEPSLIHPGETLVLPSLA